MSLKLLGWEAIHVNKDKKLQIIKFENNTHNLDPAAIFTFRSISSKCLTFP